MIQNVLVLGAGSAGLLAAIGLKRKIPKLGVRIVRSPDIGVIGVGEGTTTTFPAYLFDYLGIGRKAFYAAAQPTWKLGIRFVWGPREDFFYSFTRPLESRWNGLARYPGYYCEENFSNLDLAYALMEQGKVFPRQPNGAPDIQPWHGFHIENRKLVDVLETLARQIGIEIIDGKVSGSERGPEGISAVFLEDGRRLDADFFIDSSGFRSELIGRTFEEPFIDYTRSLWCDRAVVGGWQRTDEPILPYTTAETMDAGWAWQIEHEHFINRGYVYSSRFISDDDAEAEFRRKNPKVESARMVKFRSGRYRNSWVENVVAIGNSGGFVEPLEASALMVVTAQVETLALCLEQSGMSPKPTLRSLYNHGVSLMWEEIRDFLALHYWANTRLETPFWRECREDIDVSGIEHLLEFYKENGPTGLGKYLLPEARTNYGIEGYLIHLVGMRVPHGNPYVPTTAENDLWTRLRSGNAARASTGLDVKEALAYIRHPGWQWHGDAAQKTPPVPAMA